MDCDATLCALCDLEKSLQDAVARRTAVDEEHVDVVEAGIDETPRVIDLLVQSYDRRHVALAEVWEVGLGRVQGVAWERSGTFISVQTPDQSINQTLLFCPKRNIT